MDSMEAICTRLREERVRLGDSQRDFAEAAGISRRTQMAYENGNSAPDIGYLRGIADRGADVYYILSGRRDGDLTPGHVAIERLAGFGPPDGPLHVVLPEFLVRRKIGMTPIEHVRWAVNPSRAMEPEIEQHAIVLVDVSQSNLAEAVDGTTYAYALWDRPDVRRVLNRRDHWTVAGYGKGADSVDVYKTDADSLALFGPVIGVL